jgi:hypothetical protein
MLLVFIVRCVVIESEPSWDAMMDVKVRLLGEELRIRFEGGTELELSLLLAIVVTGLGGECNL